ncbi:MAG: hypothetical protein KUF75_02045 [Candidatus Thiodiazotropha sp. (ex Ctena orbiculata)]|nr:hypothetical protein [Candidatus Thiodiazotropha sp. (ex Codakia orbicularis)]MBV2123912.1 hypothetical protein [Candidatus Thiodiazotropha taylori]
MEREELARNIEKAFGFLETKYGFGKPVRKDYGREVFFEYERNADTVSISFEVGSAPLVEVFIPVEGTDYTPVPWAVKNNIQRARLFTKLQVNQKFQPNDSKKVAKYLGEMTEQFESSQAEWLNA